MTRLIGAVLAAVMVVSLAACTSNETSQNTTTSSTPMQTTTTKTTTTTMDSSLPYEENASIMISGKLYMLTGETVRTDELGPQLISVSDEVTGDPKNDGEAFGIPKETKIYQIKNNTTNDAVAVEIEGTYYRATVKQETSSGTATTSVKTSTATTTTKAK